MNATFLDSSDPKTKDFLAKIGEVVVLSRHLESIVEFFLEDLINPEGEPIVKQRITNSVAKSLEFQEKLDLVRDIIVERLGVAGQEKFLPTYKLVKTCIENRNDVAHSQWFIQYGNLTEGIVLSTHKINIKKGFVRGKYFDFSKALKDVDLESLAGLIDNSNKAITEIIKFMANKGEI